MMKNDFPASPRRKAELLSPAGDAERLHMAVLYGADAVYLAGSAFGMRAFAGNFTDEAIADAVAFAHAHHVKVYVTVNTLPRSDELAALPPYAEHLAHCGVDAVIVTDPGVATLIKRYAPHMELHISTQAGIVNDASARFWYDFGARRVVLARELTLDEIAQIRAKSPRDLELEVFVHGAMCVSYSGRCLLSNYMTGRDANRGACAQPCRYQYALMEEKRPGEYFPVYEDAEGTYIMNSKDLCMIDYLPALIDAGVDSLKIEGRAKSAYYTAVITSAYRHCLDAALHGEAIDPLWRNEVEHVSHRHYSTGFFFGEAEQFTQSARYLRRRQVCAIVESCDEEGNAILSLRNKFAVGDTVELVSPVRAPDAMVVPSLYDLSGAALEEVRTPQMRFRMRLPYAVPPFSILRRAVELSGK